MVINLTRDDSFLTLLELSRRYDIQHYHNVNGMNTFKKKKKKKHSCLFCGNPTCGTFIGPIRG